MSSGAAGLRGFTWRMAPLRVMAEWARDRSTLQLSQSVRQEQAGLALSRELALQYERQATFVPTTVAHMFDGALHAQRLAYLAHLRLQCGKADDNHVLQLEQVVHCRAECSGRMRDLEGLQRARAQALRIHVRAQRNMGAAEADRDWLARCSVAVE